MRRVARADDTPDMRLTGHRARPEPGPNRSAGRHRVVIIGAGFGGMSAARALRRAPVEITIIDRTNHHLFQPLLYQVATGVIPEGDVAPPTREVLRRQGNVRVLLGEVVDIDVAAREVLLNTAGNASRIAYDSLIVAAGAGQSYLGHDEFAKHAPGLKTLEDALHLRQRIFGAFELAELERDPQRRDGWLTFAVIGAGPTGVELAGQLAELSRRALKGDYVNFDPARARIILLDAVDAVLPTFPAPLQRRARADLERLGVEIHLGTRVTGIDRTGLEIQTRGSSAGRLEAYTKVWAAGVQASPLGALLAERTGARIDRAGRVDVRPDCTVPGHPEVFVIGDLMALDHIPGLAEAAMQSGRYAAKTVARRTSGIVPEPEPFHYHDVGTMATIARFRAVAWSGNLRVTGGVAWVMWLVVHLAFLTGYKNRLFAVANWTVAFLGRDLRQRTVTERQLAAQTAPTDQPAARLSRANCPLADANHAYTIDTVGKLQTTTGGQHEQY
jgi:NADH dehydrogenase